eukprot:CAMPEP_0116144124 /NCGR_PEP_ID=MMETSP0329-20121206/15824_1 /TAXON_ID=697910 /ORGANISM="Pseudo-nitzschia arenysensis, Strain B593" /LENGTH=105 /DNA_ID=CAMNT_0003639505 /DNA_START=51 /DNA_END=368 /DNA_ORIENTATION=-
MAASRGYKAARVACRKAQGFIDVGKRRNVASIQSYSFLTTGQESSISDTRAAQRASNMSWRGMSHFAINNEVPLQQSSNDETGLSEMSQIRFIGALQALEEDDGG